MFSSTVEGARVIPAADYILNQIITLSDNVNIPNLFVLLYQQMDYTPLNRS